jgi:hypothetical protein
MRLSAGPAASVVDARTEEVAWIDQALEARRPHRRRPGIRWRGNHPGTSHQSRATHPACTVTGGAAVTNCCHRVFSTITSLFDTLSHAGGCTAEPSPGTGDYRPVLAVRCGSGPVVGTWRCCSGLTELFNAVAGKGVTRPGVMTQVQPPGTLRFDMDQQAEA